MGKTAWWGSTILSGHMSLLASRRHSTGAGPELAVPLYKVQIAGHVCEASTKMPGCGARSVETMPDADMKPPAASIAVAPLPTGRALELLHPHRKTFTTFAPAVLLFSQSLCSFECK